MRLLVSGLIRTPARGRPHECARRRRLTRTRGFAAHTNWLPRHDSELKSIIPTFFFIFFESYAVVNLIFIISIGGGIWEGDGEMGRGWGRWKKWEKMRGKEKRRKGRKGERGLRDYEIEKKEKKKKEGGGGGEEGKPEEKGKRESQRGKSKREGVNEKYLV